MIMISAIILAAGESKRMGQPKMLLPWGHTTVLGHVIEVQESVVRGILQRFEQEQVPLIVPSYKMRRGHPWLVSRTLWPAILDLKSASSTREFLMKYASQITYLIVETPSVVEDLDTPEEYQQQIKRTDKFH